MRKCCECGKQLKFWEGYLHPAGGKKEIICWNCFENIEESMENYRNFISSYFKQEEQNSKLNNSDIKSKFLKLVQ